VVSFTIRNLDNDEAGYILAKAYNIITRTGLHCAPLVHDRIDGGKGCIRVSFSCLNTPAECRRAADAVREVAEGLVYRDFITVGILLDRLHVLEKGKPPQTAVRDNWIYVQDAGVRVGRIQIFNNWSPYLAADHERTVWIGLEYFVGLGDDLWRMPDEELVRLAVRELERIGFARAADVRDSCVLRVPDAYPAYFGGYARFDEIRRWASGIPNLLCVGRNGMHRYNNQDHSMLTAMLAVDNIAAGREDDSAIWDVNMEMVYGEVGG